MLNFNVTDPEKPDYVDPDVIRLSRYWYLSKGNVVKAKNLLEALQLAERGYYMLGDHPGSLDCPSSGLSGNIWHISSGLIETLSEFLETSFINHERLVRDFYNKCANFWIIFPTSEADYKKWIFHYKHAKYYPYAFLSYEIRNGSAKISTDLCWFCNACTTD